VCQKYVDGVWVYICLFSLLSFFLSLSLTLTRKLATLLHKYIHTLSLSLTQPHTFIYTLTHCLSFIHTHTYTHILYTLTHSHYSHCHTHSATTVLRTQVRPSMLGVAGPALPNIHPPRRSTPDVILHVYFESDSRFFSALDESLPAGDQKGVWGT